MAECPFDFVSVTIRSWLSKCCLNARISGGVHVAMVRSMNLEVGD
jgi:hypothetical protein